MAANYPGSTPDLGPPPPLIPPLEKAIGEHKFAFYSKRTSDDIHPSGLVEHFTDVANENTEFHSDIARYLPLLTPKLTKAGKIAVRQPYVPKRSEKWWKAQCAFRDLPMAGNILDLQARLRKYGDKGMSKRMVELRDRMKREWNEKNFKKLENEWEASDDSEKAQLWPKRFLHEKFIAPPEKRQDAIVVRVADWDIAMEISALDMGITCETTSGHYEPGIRDVVLGINQQAVRAKSAELSREFERARREEEQAKAKREREKMEALQKQHTSAVEHEGNLSGNWSVDGIWSICCPYIEEQWGSKGHGCTLEIGLVDDGEHVQMYARFDFIALTGVMRFVNPQVPFQADDDDRENIYEDEQDSEEDGETPAHFLFSRSQLVSSINHEFSYRWRGEETGEGEIQLYSDRALCTLNFLSPNSLNATFESDLTDKIPFTGVKKKGQDNAKVGQKRKRVPNVNHEWRSRNGAAYERARVGRWH
jgi:hypothetical protein